MLTDQLERTVPLPDHVESDLATCASEPIHIPGAIQPHGCLIACEMGGWTITHASANAAAMLGFDAAGPLLGQPLDQILSGSAVHDIRNILQSAMVSGGAESLYDIAVKDGGPHADVIVHVSGALAVVEFLPKTEAQSATRAPMTLVRSMIGRLRRATSLERLFVMSATQLRAVTGFDRVMIYKFLEDGTGQVLAESLRSGLQPFLGLRYPASDIPPQARNLYLRQWVRLIPTVSYTPAPLLAADSAAAPLDLGLATLRSVSPIHLEYLLNMESAATLTVSIIIGDRLWGLIACHHQAPRLLSAATCGACELFGQVLSLQIEAREQAVELASVARSREAHDRLIASMPPEETLFDNLAPYADLLGDLVACDGVGVWTFGVFSGVGVLPPLEAMPGLIDFLGWGEAQQIFATNCLSREHPDAANYPDRVSGLLAIPFSRSPRDYLMFFRRELVETVTWGGNPNKAVQITSTGRIGPRQSFEAWTEQVRGKSAKWSAAELKIAEALRVSLLDVILRRSELIEQERQSAQESQSLLVAELNHRVKNILALIRSLVRQSSQGAVSITSFTGDLEKRISSLALAHDQMTQSGWSSAPLRRLLQAEVEAWTQSSSDAVVLTGPNVELDSRAYQALALVFHEMMTNAAKYGALSTPRGVLKVDWRLNAERKLTIDWTETGGPPVVPPKRRGFGTVVIHQTVPFELRGETKVEYRPEGVQARFVVPALHVSMGSDPVPVQAAAREPQISLDGKRLLLVEDSMMIALDAQSGLQHAGVLVEVAGTISDALRAVQIDKFDAAILDINLSGETSFPVAERCAETGLPFVFATGYGESVVVPDRFKDVPIVAKPYDERALRVALGSVASIAAEAD